jgi:hypothetical protein
MSEIVFILGAGASRESGAPLMSDFLDRAEQLRRNKEVDEAGEDFDRVFDAISELMRVHSKSELDIYNIESVFAAFEMGRLVGGLPGVPEDKMDSLLASIRTLITKTIEKTVVFRYEKGRAHPTPSYHSLALTMKSLNKDTEHRRCSVITFNYDLALDYALEFVECPIDYRLAQGREPIATSLMKLHGSLNWAACRKCGAIIPWQLKAYLHEHPLPFLEEGDSVRLNLGSSLAEACLTHCGTQLGVNPRLFRQHGTKRGTTPVYRMCGAVQHPN